MPPGIGARFQYNAEVQAIVSAFIQNTAYSVDSFIALFGPFVESSVRHILRDRGDMEQAVIDVFFKLWRSRARLPQDETILYYILAVSRRVAIDHYRKEKRRCPPGLLSAQTLTDLAEHEVSGPDPALFRLELEGLFEPLEPETRTLFWEYYVEGRTAKELAVRHGVRLPTIYTRLRRAKITLQKRRASYDRP